MIIKSTYPTMEESTRLIPPDVNVKLMLRHSLRQSLKGIEQPENVSLTIKGEKLAYDFGANLEYPIGTVCSSVVQRCQQTVDYILKGKNIDNHTAIKLIDMRKFYASDVLLSNQNFDLIKSGKILISKLLKNENIPGFYSIKECAEKQLDFIFDIGNKWSTIDLFCTHDFQIMCLVSWLFNYSSDVEFIRKEWPQMLEGVFFWGSRDDFYCIWRANVMHFCQ